MFVEGEDVTLFLVHKGDRSGIYLDDCHSLLAKVKLELLVDPTKVPRHPPMLTRGFLDGFF